MSEKGQIITGVKKGSIAEELEIKPGFILYKINNETVEDIFDYNYLITNENLEILIGDGNGHEWYCEAEKEENEDLGLCFKEGLMDDYRTCRNKCMFCFIDQMPKGLRDTLYFKDDDARLSFLQGNYITLTNLTKRDVEKIIKYRFSPVQISIHTTDSNLRCKMLKNRFAGESLKILDRFYEENIAMNAQIVLCKGINDKEALKKTLSDLEKYAPVMKSVSVVPVGLTKYRDGLFPLQKLEKEDADDAIDIVEEFQKRMYEKEKMHFVHASDELYLLAGRDIPEEERYDGYLQFENGVGMVRQFSEDVCRSVLKYKDYIISELKKKDYTKGKKEQVSVATGKLAYPIINYAVKQITDSIPAVKIYVYEIINDFFGHDITVAGLITGRDLISQLKGKKLGKRLLLTENMFRKGEEIMLDNVTKDDLETTLQVKINIVKSTAKDLIFDIFDIEKKEDTDTYRAYEIL